MTWSAWLSIRFGNYQYDRSSMLRLIAASAVATFRPQPRKAWLLATGQDRGADAAESIFEEARSRTSAPYDFVTGSPRVLKLEVHVRRDLLWEIVFDVPFTRRCPAAAAVQRTGGRRSETGRARSSSHAPEDPDMLFVVVDRCGVVVPLDLGDGAFMVGHEGSGDAEVPGCAWTAAFAGPCRSPPARRAISLALHFWKSRLSLGSLEPRPVKRQIARPVAPSTARRTPSASDCHSFVAAFAGLA